MAFLNVFFSEGGLPEINLANVWLPFIHSSLTKVWLIEWKICSAETGVFPGTELANCQFLAADIKACQAKGKIVTLSLGGATGAAMFSSDAQAQTFADTIWNLFLGGSSSTRPFADAVLDGVDLDIEGGGSTGLAAFVSRIRSHASGASKTWLPNFIHDLLLTECGSTKVLRHCCTSMPLPRCFPRLSFECGWIWCCLCPMWVTGLIATDMRYLTKFPVYNNFCGWDHGLIFHGPYSWMNPVSRISTIPT